METKGIILTGGRGPRLWPLTHGISKQLLPIYDKSMIYYLLATLMASQIRQILLITTPEDQSHFRQFLGNGQRFGIELNYQTQEFPNSIAEALVLGGDFLDRAGCALILGNNIFYGTSKLNSLSALANTAGGTIFAHEVSDASRYGVVEVDSQAPAIARTLVPSPRGELEITDLNYKYLAESELRVVILEKESTWLDAGTFESLHTASSFVKAVQERKGIKIACLEEIGFRNRWLTRAQILESANYYPNSSYSDYLTTLANLNWESVSSR